MSSAQNVLTPTEYTTTTTSLSSTHPHSSTSGAVDGDTPSTAAHALPPAVSANHQHNDTNNNDTNNNDTNNNDTNNNDTNNNDTNNNDTNNNVPNNNVTNNDNNAPSYNNDANNNNIPNNASNNNVPNNNDDNNAPINNNAPSNNNDLPDANAYANANSSVASIPSPSPSSSSDPNPYPSSASSTAPPEIQPSHPINNANNVASSAAEPPSSSSSASSTTQPEKQPSNENGAPQSSSSSSSSPSPPSDDKILYEGKVLTKHSRLVILTLRKDNITWQEKVTCSLPLSDIIGVTTIHKFFTIHYVKHKVKDTLTFKCENDSIPKQWADNINNALKLDGKGSQGCRIVFVVNPFSGTRKALSVLASVRHLFDIAGMNVTVIAGHAREIGRTIDIATVDRLVCVSGDGLFNELINGIMDRPDWSDAIKIPLGIIPAGSGNGLAYSLGNANPTEAAFAIIKGTFRPFDILRTTQNGVSLYGFLTLTWAMISDVDIESEKMRWMGALRFSIGALKRVISLRKYKGRLTYLPAEEALEPHAPCSSYKKCNHCNRAPVYIAEEQALPKDLRSILYDPSQPPPEGWKVLDDEFVVFIATNVPHISTDFHASPYPVFYTKKQNTISFTLLIHAHLSDGAVDLILIRATPELTKAKLVSLLLQTETDIHSPLVEHYKAKALYLEPGRVVNHKEGDDVGVMAVDGEKVAYAPIGVEVFRGLFNILCYE